MQVLHALYIEVQKVLHFPLKWIYQTFGVILQMENHAALLIPENKIFFIFTEMHLYLVCGFCISTNAKNPALSDAAKGTVTPAMLLTIPTDY